MPANTFVSVVWAARPAITPTIPADASRDAPSVRSCVKVMNIEAIAMIVIAAPVSLRISATWVRSRLIRRLSGTSMLSRFRTVSSMTNSVRTTSHADTPISASSNACRTPATTRFSMSNRTT
jgi:hypothetical protein